LAPRPIQYGTSHDKMRRYFQRIIDSGEIVMCANPRCTHPGGRQIIPGQAWDLGHEPGDPMRYRGPEHRRCNRATASQRKTLAPARRRQSRVW
jgi:hypothetical protein